MTALDANKCSVYTIVLTNMTRIQKYHPISLMFLLRLHYQIEPDVCA